MYRPKMSKEQAEKLFNRKADPDASLSPKEFMKKKMNSFVMSNGVGKVLDSKVGKKMVGVGNTVIKGVKKLKPDMKKITDDLFGSPELNKKQREAGAKLNREYSGLPSNIKYRK